MVDDFTTLEIVPITMPERGGEKNLGIKSPLKYGQLPLMAHHAQTSAEWRDFKPLDRATFGLWGLRDQSKREGDPLVYLMAIAIITWVSNM